MKRRVQSRPGVRQENRFLRHFPAILLTPGGLTRPWVPRGWWCTKGKGKVNHWPWEVNLSFIFLSIRHHPTFVSDGNIPSCPRERRNIIRDWPLLCSGGSISGTFLHLGPLGENINESLWCNWWKTNRSWKQRKNNINFYILVFLFIRKLHQIHFVFLLIVLGY